MDVRETIMQYLIHDTSLIYKPMWSYTTTNNIHKIYTYDIYYHTTYVITISIKNTNISYGLVTGGSAFKSFNIHDIDKAKRYLLDMAREMGGINECL